MSARAFELPPLELLVAFESAARHLSFTRAGAEIALTQSAVSRQMLGARGSSRRRALSPPAPRARPDRGRRDASTPPIVEALSRLDRATRAIRHSERAQTVVVTTTPGFAGLWLIPRLTSFVADHPEVDVRISASNALVNLERDGVDIWRSATGRCEAAGPDDGVRLFGETVSPGVQPAPAAPAASAAGAARRSRRPHPAAHGARRRQPAAGLGPVAAGDEARRPAPGRRPPFLVVRPADLGGDRGAGHRARPGAADRQPC